MSRHIHRAEVDKFDAQATEWWDQENGAHRLLHQLNPVRLEYIHQMITQYLPEQSSIHILDAGCGGGIISEPLARSGFSVTGVDASAASIEVAKAHAQDSHLNIRYICGDIDNIDESFDVICALEIIEHVADVAYFLQVLKSKLKPGGLLIVSTLNRTFLSYAGAILWAEHIARIVPQGTHQWAHFVTPYEILQGLEWDQTSIRNMQGYTYNPLKQSWVLCQSLKVNYFMTLQETRL